MTDAENTSQPSKKRAAGRELSRDNAGLDDEEEVPGQETGTFKRASEEVIANRRIVKVKRSQPSSSNPFAAILLVPPTDTTSEQDTSTSSVNKKSENEDDKQAENKADKAELAQNASVNSFQQLSSSQNAFTGLVRTRFSTSTFSFGSIQNPENLPTFPSISFGTSLFSKPDETERRKIPSMHEVQVKTGEENETTLFTAESALFEFIDSVWKERGKGELKVNVSKSESKKARLVMRARGNYRLILNANIYPEMKLKNMERKGVTFACLSSTSDVKDGFSTFGLKFRDASIVDMFRSVVMAHAAKPKTSDE